MIQIGDYTIDLNDPLHLTAVIAAAGFLLILLLLILSLRAARRSARMALPLAQHMQALGGQVQEIGANQKLLEGGLRTVSDAQASGQAQIVQTVESRINHVQLQMQEKLADNAARSARSLSEMQQRIGESLHGSTQRTTTSLTQLQERLAAIDRAQENITKLSGDVLSLQDILSNKQRRGMFGEVQLQDIVSKALPSDAYAFQYQLSNNTRPDCIVHLPNPPGPIAIDAKFPLEDFEALAAAETKEDAERKLKAFGNAVRVHIKAIAEKYIIDGETADGALMFVPSEAIYAELHARLPHIVREGFAARVWIVSPTTCMATLNTMRAVLKDARMREQAGAIRKMLGQLHRDVELVLERTAKLETHFDQARRDVDGIATAAERAGKRAAKLDNFDFEELSEPETNATVVPLGRPEGKS